jgi:hypothetical protein
MSKKSMQITRRKQMEQKVKDGSVTQENFDKLYPTRSKITKAKEKNNK